jgi:ubiquinone/menaquinone biosynthesis C-methylase UbiE
MHRPPSILDQQYQTDIHKVWHSSTPPPELVAALDDGWLGTPQHALDLGCGLGTEPAYLAQRGVPLTVGVDRSSAALSRAHHLHPAVQFVQADVRQLPFDDHSFDVALDRGCLHYLQAADRPRYASEVERVLRPGGRFLLRACLYAQGIRNDLTEPLIRQIFTRWHIVSLQQAPIPSDTRQMIALVTRLEHPKT